jgi:hypothetical protein
MRFGLRPLTILLVLSGILDPARAAEHSETVRRTFKLDPVAGHRLLVVDNVSGSITIEAAAGEGVELTLEQKLTARSDADLDRARREVQLEVDEQPGRLELVQGGPWRCRDRERNGLGRGRGDCCCDVDERRYEARFDWTLRVPRDIDLDVRNVNEGAVRIAGTSGRLDVRHVNDAVTLEHVRGPVDAQTVNGKLAVTFDVVPGSDCRFGTVNGDIDLAFPGRLGAELSFSTLNGEVYTDFPFKLAQPRATSEHTTEGRRHRHALGRTTRATLGGGGIGLTCSTLNGDIYIRERS